MQCIKGGEFDFGMYESKVAVEIPNSALSPDSCIKGYLNLEAASGFEPLHKGFADLSLSHLGTPPKIVMRNP
jgi:hypothetical protein